MLTRLRMMSVWIWGELGVGKMRILWVRIMVLILVVARGTWGRLRRRG